MPVLLDTATVPSFPFCPESLLDSVLAAAPGTIAQLDAGANLLFAGCGRAGVLVEIARQFPRSRFLGVEPSPDVLYAAHLAVRKGGVQNTTLGRPDMVRRAYLQGIFNFVLRHGGETSAPLDSVPGLLRDGGLLFDVGSDRLSPADYHDAGLVILRSLRLPAGGTAVIAGNWSQPAPRA
jgi:hypothetical protein